MSAKNRLTEPPLNKGVPGSLKLDNYVIYELFLRQDHPEYFTEEEQTLEATLETARIEREREEALLR